MENLPSYISITFGITTIITVMLFFNATRKSWVSLIILLSWLILQGFIAYSGFYTVIDVFPPRFLLQVIPPFIFIAGLFFTAKGRGFIDSLDPKILTILHIVRIPVEIVLFWLFIQKTIPQIMTFEGRNYDILAGISAPIIYYFGFVNKQIHRNILLTWNFICVGLLANIVVIAILSSPIAIQKFAFDQPNIAVLYFPFNWLPSCIVPLVFLSHFAVIRHLVTQIKNEKEIFP